MATREKEVKIAHAGRAWEISQSKRPEIVLYGEDLEHPTEAGTMLAAAVVYSTIYGVEPPADATVPLGVEVEEADMRFLHEVAWEVAGRK